MRTIISTISAAVMLFALSLPMMSVVKAAEFFTIGTGGPTGGYFQVGNSVCKMLHKQAISAEHGRKKVQLKHTDVPLLQLVDQTTILVKSKLENSSLVLLSLTGSFMLIMVQANGKEKSLVI